MLKNNDNATAWNVIDSMFGDHSEFRSKMEALRSPKRVKKMVKQMVSGATQSEAIAELELLMKAMRSVHVNRATESRDALLGVNMDMVMKPEPLEKGACEAEIAQHKMDWNVYTISEAYRLSHVAILVIDAVLDDTKKMVRAGLTAIVSAYSKGMRDELIVTAILNSVKRAIGAGNIDEAMAFIEIVKTAGFISVRRAVTNEGRTEFVFSVKQDTKDLRKAVKVTSDRAIQLFKIEPVTGNIAIRAKFDYQQDVEPMADVVDYLNSVPVKFKDSVTEADIVEIARDAIEDEDGSRLFDIDWKQGIKRDLINEWGITVESGNKFFIPRKSDGVARLYGNSKFGFDMGHAHQDLLEFANKEELNEDGLWSLRQYFAEVEGYRVNGKKPTEQEAEDFWNDSVHSEGEAFTQKGQEIVDIYFSNEVTGLAVEIDAQTQGPGIMGLSVGDESLCFNTAIIGNTIRTDMYLLLANAMNSRLSVTAWTRTNSKSALMTKGYGAGYKTIMFGSKGSNDMETGMYEIKAGGKKQVPLMHTAEAAGISSTKDVWVAFKKTMKIIAPAMLELQALISNIQEGLGNAENSYMLPDGVMATVATQKTIETHAKWVSGDGKIHSMLHHVRVPDDSNTTALAPRIVQSIDAYILRCVARIMSDQGIELIVVHDGYITHPNYSKKLMEAYRTVLAHVYEIDLMTNILSQLLGTEISSVQKDSKITTEDILASKYALWF